MKLQDFRGAADDGDEALKYLKSLAALSGLNEETQALRRTAHMAETGGGLKVVYFLPKPHKVIGNGGYFYQTSIEKAVIPFPYALPISHFSPFFPSIGLHLDPIFPISSQVPIPPSPVPQEDGAASGARPTGHAAHVRGHASAAPRAAQLPRVQRDATPARSHQVGATCPGRGGG